MNAGFGIVTQCSVASGATISNHFFKIYQRRLIEE